MADDGRGGADPAHGTGLRGLQDRIATLGGALTVHSPVGAGTRLFARIPLAPWRTARQPYLEFGAPDDGGDGAAAIAAILDGRRTGAISIARERELEGGVPGIGTLLPVRDHTGREHGAVIVRRVSIVPLGADRRARRRGARHRGRPSPTSTAGRRGAGATTARRSAFLFGDRTGSSRRRADGRPLFRTE